MVFAHIRSMNRHIPALTAFMLTVALFVTLFGNFLGAPLLSFAEEVKVIYLTFDDGPSDRVTPKILDVLKEENVPATFFIVGNCAKTRRDILKRAYDEGHTLAVHSYSHNYGTIYASAEALIDDIEKCNEIICSITGEYSSLYRFPGGSYTVSSELIKAVVSNGYRFINWNASFCDSEIKNATSEDLYDAAVATVANPHRIVMLAHDATDKLETVAALKQVIRHFKRLGYSFMKF